MLPSTDQRWIRLLFLLFLFLSGVSSRAQFTQLPQPELITDRQGLPQGFVSGLVQDRQGFIWMATHDGLCRYDGYQFKVFRYQPDDSLSLPFSNVAALRLDHLGRIWLRSEENEIIFFNPRTELFTNISRQVRTRQHFNVGERLRDFFLDRQNRLWLAHDSLGLVCYEMPTGRFRWFRHQDHQPHSLGSDQLRCVLQDQQGVIWIATADAGLERFDDKSGHFVHYRPGSKPSLPLPELAIYGLYEQPSGELLLGMHHYVCRFNPKTGQFRAYRLPAEGNPAWGEHHLWGTRFVSDSRGVVYFDQRDRLFRLTEPDGIQLLTRFTPQTGFCTSLLIDRSDVLWMGTDGSGVRKYDLQGDGFQTARYRVNFQTDLLTNWLQVSLPQAGPVQANNPYLFRYTLDRQGCIWANVGSSVFYHIDLGQRQTKRVDFPLPFTSSVSPLATDPQGQVWVLHQNTLWYYDPDRRQWRQWGYPLNQASTSEIVQLVADDQAFWLASQGQGLFRLDRRTGQLRQYAHRANQPTSLSSNGIYCLSADPADPNRLWIGTFNSGLCAFDKRSGQCRRITEQDGLPNNVIYSALPDARGYLWIGTNKGLCRMHRRTFQMHTYTVEDGLLANEFNRFHYLQLPSGQIMMGGVEGLTAFQPTHLKDDSFRPPVELTELYVNNRLVKPAARSALSQPIQATQQLTLPYNQNFLTVRFAALQYNRPGKNRYRYQLEGLDPGWVETSRPEALYTALPPGPYTLLVNAANTSGAWSPQVRRLAIVIQPPYWATWWAYLVYGLAVVGGLWYAVRLRLNQLQLQQSVALRQQEARQLRELDQMKSRFFTNVTHDFRTPLTLILSPLAGLIQEQADTRSVKRLESIRRNAQQLLNLINQLLDFSKLDAGALTLQEARGNVSQFVQQALSLFRDEAARKAITITYRSSVPGEYWFDADKLERILSNLLGNALKFTPAGGQITVSLQEADGIELTISDTGVGIAVEQLPHIFDRFFQGATNGSETNPSATETPQQMGTGIGLAVVKELVDLQRGQIMAESQPGEGTTFRIRLPYRKADDLLPSIDTVVEDLVVSQHGEVTEQDDEHPLGDTPVRDTPVQEQPHLLLVEDNPELAEFIADSLPAHYRVSRAANGVEGLQQALADLPDLVISDVMMPLMDGYTLCQKLKDDERTNHIPVILLTAKVTLDNRLEGLTRGADDYLTKPFHVQELTLRVHNLLERQRRFRERMRQQLIRPGLDGPGLEGSGRADGSLEESDSYTSVDALPDPFLEKLYAVIEEKLDDTTLSVEELTERLNLSRSSLHRKVKALTGLATGDVIRIYRLKRATQYLRQGYNSSETADRVGFDSSQYFAKCFREQYQMTPSEFAQRTKKNPPIDQYRVN